jgi:hypothetical protein
MFNLEKSDPWRVTSWDRERARWRFLSLQTTDLGRQIAPTIVAALISLVAALRYGALGDISQSGILVLGVIAVGSPILGRLWVMLAGRLTVDEDMEKARREKEDLDHAVWHSRTHG